LLLGGCTFGQAPPPTPIPLLPHTVAAATARDAGALHQVYTVQRGTVRDEMAFAAKVAPAKMEDLFFGAPGRVQEVYVPSGARVGLDQVIAVLDTRLLELDRAAALETLHLARQRLALAEANLRFTTLQREIDVQAEEIKLRQIEDDPQADPRAVALQALAVRAAELARQQLEAGVEPTLAADVRRAEIALRKIETALADAQISAPFAGQVLLYDALEKGKVVQAYAPVAALVDPAALVLEANLLPADLQNLHEGMAVAIELGGTGTQPVGGTRSVAGVVRTLPQPFGTGAGPATVVVPTETAARELRPGTTVQVRVQRAAQAQALWLPPEAIQGYKDHYYVRLVDGSERPVQVGIFAANRVEIAAGLHFGEEVIGGN
jgi:multidrug efflux pump subunit AcrA (membrane-fusion protein)